MLPALKWFENYWKNIKYKRKEDLRNGYGV